MNRRDPRQARRLVGTAGLGFHTGFSPAQIPGLVLWLRADSGITLATGVSQWVDMASGYKFTQSTGSAQPSYQSSNAAYNGQPTLGFNAASVQNLMSTASVGTYAQPLTVFLVGNVTSRSTTQIYWNDVAGLNMATQTGNTTMYGGSSGTLTIAGANSAQMLYGIYNGAASTFGCNVSAQKATGTLGASVSMSGTMAIGATTSGTLPLTGTIAEIFVATGAQSSAIIADAIQYGAGRYGYTVS